MSINKKWHEQHKMPKTPTLEQRIRWHLAHEKNCTCRPIPEKLMHKIHEKKVME
jgi:hypothetical protein